MLLRNQTSPDPIGNRDTIPSTTNRSLVPDTDWFIRPARKEPELKQSTSRLHCRPKSLGSAELQWGVMQLLLGSHLRARGLWDRISRPFPSNCEVSLDPSFRRDHVF